MLTLLQNYIFLRYKVKKNCLCLNLSNQAKKKYRNKLEEPSQFDTIAQFLLHHFEFIRQDFEFLSSFHLDFDLLP